MELLGTLFLALAIVFTGNPLSSGLMLLAMVYIGMHISGAHFNPAISLAAFLHGAMDIVEMLKYWTAQVIGGLAAAYIYYLVIETMFLPEVSAETVVWKSSFLEGLLTAVFVLAFLTAILQTRLKGTAVYGAIIGLTWVAIGSVFPVGLFNPAIPLGGIICNLLTGGAMVSGNAAFIYLVAPLIGGAVALYTYDYLNQE